MASTALLERVAPQLLAMAEAVRSPEGSSAAVLAAHRTMGGERKATLSKMSESVNVTPRAAPGARADPRARSGAPAVAARGSCKPESSRGFGEGGDGGGGAGGVLAARQNTALRCLLPCFVSCVVV